MFSKKVNFFQFFFGVLIATTLAWQPVSAQWVPDDEGNLHWWEPPKEPIYKIEKRPVVLGQCDAQVLFMMDTSGSMSDEFDVLCNKINDIVQDLQDGGITIDYEILGIHATRNCATGTVSGSVPNPTVNHIEDWGPAVEDVAEQYNWESGYVRIAIPMSDEGAENGDSWTSADDDAIDRAKEAARNNSVGVIPIIGTPWSPSQYPMIVAGAQELANYCWGQAFLSTDPTQDLVDGIVQAINDLCTPISDKVDVGIYVDDAFADAGTKGYVNKIPGDIAFLVAQITNGADQAFTGDLKISFPNTWNLVDHDNVMRRKKGEPWIEEACTESVDKSTQGEVVIEGISIPKDDNATSNENEGKTREYVVKVIIPKSQIANVCMNVNAEVTPSVGGSSFLTANDSFMVSVNSIGDMILTNRHLLFERHSDKEKVLEILKETQKIAQKQSAVVFYVDWWDKYDDFAKDSDGNWLNPGNGRTGTDDKGDTSISKSDYTNPIKWWGWDSTDQEWDRDIDSNATQTEAAVNTIPNYIDEYIHYWADQLRDSTRDENYLLIVGGDNIIPFYRFQDPTNTTRNDPNTAGITDHLLALANSNYALSDIKYADTDNIGWRDGGADAIYVGRIVGENAEVIHDCVSYSSKFRNNDHATVTSFGTGNFIDQARDLVSVLEDANYDVNDEVNGQSLIDDQGWDWDDVKETFLDDTDYFIYRGHGLPTTVGFGITGVTYDDTVDSNGISLSTLFYFDQPFHIYLACLCGLADHDATHANTDLLTYGAVRKNVLNYLGATTRSRNAYNKEFGQRYLRYITGSRPDANTAPISVGESLNRSKRETQNQRDISGYSRTTFAYTLYGFPWNMYAQPTAAPTAAIALSVCSSTLDTKKSGICAGYVKTHNETVGSYQIVQQEGFDFISIPGYNNLECGLNTTPVLPMKEFEITLHKDATITNVTVNRSNPVNLGVLNIPVYYDEPPLAGQPPLQEYNTAPDSIGFFDFGFEQFVAENPNNRKLIIKVVPATYNTLMDEAVLYQNYEISVNYETASKGVLVSAGTDKINYACDETVNVPVSVENVVDTATLFDINVELKNMQQKVLQTQSISLTIDPNQIAQTTLQLTAPSVGGSYWVFTTVSHGTQEIGTSSEHININPGDITDIVVPRCIPGGTSEFTVTFHNSSGGDIEVAFGLSIYEGATLRADFIPVIYNVSADTDQMASFKWEIPPDFPGGNYLAVATATSSGYTSSLSEVFGIGGLDMGWNLISLPLQPNDTSIGAVLDPIAGRYLSVWAFKNGAWKVYDPANSGFSDLNTMEAGWGYWLNMNEATTLTVSGSTPSNSIDLVAGWNLVGYNSSTSQPIADALSSISGKFEFVWAYINGQWKVYDPANPGFSELTTMEPGYGYWIKTTEACTWILP